MPLSYTDITNKAVKKDDTIKLHLTFRKNISCALLTFSISSTRAGQWTSKALNALYTRDAKFVSTMPKFLSDNANSN